LTVLLASGFKVLVTVALKLRFPGVEGAVNMSVSGGAALPAASVPS
jgi:hypothetical protein